MRSCSQLRQSKVIESFFKEIFPNVKDSICLESNMREDLESKMIDSFGKGNFTALTLEEKNYSKSLVRFIISCFNPFNAFFISGSSPYSSINDCK